MENKEKKSLQQIWVYYLIFNIAFLFPICLFELIPDSIPFLFSRMPEIMGMIIVIPYMVVVLPYGILGLTYVHIAVELGFVIFAMCKLPKEKNSAVFLMTIGLTAVSIAMNLYWSTRWIMYMGV